MPLRACEMSNDHDIQVCLFVYLYHWKHVASMTYATFSDQCGGKIKIPWFHTTSTTKIWDPIINLYLYLDRKSGSKKAYVGLLCVALKGTSVPYVFLTENITYTNSKWHIRYSLYIRKGNCITKSQVLHLTSLTVV